MIKYAERQTIKSIITNKEIRPGEFEYNWQEFVIDRQEKTEQTKGTSASFKIIEKLLDQIDNNELADNIRNAILNREGDSVYICYNRGFLDGLKLALLFEKI